MADGDRDGEYTQPFTPEFTGSFTAQGLMDEPPPPPPATHPAQRNPSISRSASRNTLCLAL